MSFKELIKVRSYTENDRAFIKATFLRGLYYGDSWFSEVPKPIFMNNYSTFVDKIIDISQKDIRIACLPDDPDVILGYSVSSKESLHWVYVKEKWRKQGIGKSLLPQFKYVTHLSKLGRTLLNNYKPAVFNPFAIG